jgi:hypothetical protein
VVPAAPVEPCANAGTAITDAIIITNINITNFRIVFLLMNCPSRWLTPYFEADALTLKAGVKQQVSNNQVSGLRKNRSSNWT